MQKGKVLVKYLTAGVLLALSLATPADASSFPRDPGSWFVDVTSSYYSSSDFVNDNGTRLPSGCTFAKNEKAVYAEYGLDKANTLTFATAYDADSCGGLSTAGVADLEFGLNHNLIHRGRFNAGVRADAILPSGYTIASNPQLGYGRPGLELDAIAGGSFTLGGHNGFYDSSTGIRAYTGYPAAQYRASVSTGIDVVRGVQFLAGADYLTPIGAGSTLTNVGLNPTVQARYRSLQSTLGATLRLAPGLRGYISTTSLLAGRNTGYGRSTTIGVWADFLPPSRH
jgi:hypothetical protein